MTVVTISRELGSRGTQIAEEVARVLDTTCVDKEVLAEMAKHAGVDVEVIAESEERLMSRPMLVSSEMKSLFAARKRSSNTLSEADYIKLMSEAIRTLADQQSNVFIGRGAQLILEERPDVLRVHLYAPLDIRARRIQRRRDLDQLGVAKRIVQQSDEQRQKWYSRFFAGTDWKNSRHYHLMIDTSWVSVELATQIIANAAQAGPCDSP